MQNRNIDRQLSQVVSEAYQHVGAFQTLAASFSAGVAPDRARARTVGTEIVKRATQLSDVLDDLEQSKDFQAAEAYQIMEAQARRMNIPTMRNVQEIVSWQGYGLLAYADNLPLPDQPQGVDMAAVSQAAPGTGDPKRAIYPTGKPPALPFTDADFEKSANPEALTIKLDFERLSKEHQQLIGLGATYADFDTAGKEFYLDQIAQMTSRWQDLLEDAKDIGILPNQDFRDFSEEQLRRGEFSQKTFVGMVEDVHKALRKELAREAATGR